MMVAPAQDARATKESGRNPGCPKGYGGAAPSAALPRLNDHSGRLRRGALHPVPRRSQRDPNP